MLGFWYYLQVMAWKFVMLLKLTFGYWDQPLLRIWRLRSVLTRSTSTSMTTTASTRCVVECRRSTPTQSDRVMSSMQRLSNDLGG